MKSSLVMTVSFTSNWHITVWLHYMDIFYIFPPAVCRCKDGGRGGMARREDRESVGVDSGVAGFTDERMVGGSEMGLNTES